MPTKRIGDVDKFPSNPCVNPEHNPPGHMVFPNGVYEHTCPGCGNKIIFTVNRPVYTRHKGWKYEGPGGTSNF